MSNARLCHLAKPSTGDSTPDLKALPSHRWGAQLAELLLSSLPLFSPFLPPGPSHPRRRMRSVGRLSLALLYKKSVPSPFPIIELPNLRRKFHMCNGNAIKGSSLTHTVTTWFYAPGRGSPTVILWYLGIAVPLLILNTYVPNPPHTPRALSKYLRKPTTCNHYTSTHIKSKAFFVI